MRRNNEEGYKIISLRTETWKFIYDEEKEIEYLFNIERDPEEHTNLIDREIELTNEFRGKLANHLKKVEVINEKSKLSSVIQRLDLSKL
jgi:arylsulfatase A-like enzyme